MSDLSPDEFARFARWRSGLDPDLPPESSCEDAGWATGATGPTVSPNIGRIDHSGIGRTCDEGTADDVAEGRVGVEAIGPRGEATDSATPAKPGTSALADDGPEGNAGDDGEPTGSGQGPSDDAATDGAIRDAGEDQKRRADTEADDGSVDPEGAQSSGLDRQRGHWPTRRPRMGDFESGVDAVVTALRGLEAAGELDDESLTARVADLVRLQSLVASTLSDHLSLWDARSVWAGDRSKSPGARLAREASCAKSTASAGVMLARDVSHMPLTADAWADGRLSTDHVRRLARASADDRRERFRSDEAELIEKALALAGDFAGFNRAVEVWEQLVDDEVHDPTDPNDLPKGEKRARAGRYCQIRRSDDGFDLKASFTKLGGEIVRTQLQRCYDDLWRQDWIDARERLGIDAVISDADLGRTDRQRWADALVEMATRAGACRPGDVMPKPLVTIHVTGADMTGPIRETFNGMVMSRRDVADLIADGADWERVIYGQGGQPVNLTSVQRNFTGLLRRAVQLRDRTCSHPTCDVEAERCQVDHIVEHADGGLTNIENARLLCPKHNMQRPGRSKKIPPKDDGGGDGDGDSDSDSDGGCDGGAAGTE